MKSWLKRRRLSMGPAMLGAMLLLCGLAVGAAEKEGGSTGSQPAWTIPSNEAIRAFLAERMKSNGVGVVVGVIEPEGQRVVVYGRSGAPRNRPLDGNTVFQIGSVSKVFVGLVLADMVKRGEVKLDDSAQKYLPAGVRMPLRGRPITLADLSTHISGLPGMPDNFDVRGEPDPIEAYTVKDLHEFLNTHQLEREPGAAPEYSNLGVSLLGRLLGRKAGMEYAELVKARVLQPLGMESTSIRLSEDQLRRLAPGHDMDLMPVHSPEMKTLYPSGSLRSTANDLLRFLAANLGYLDTNLKDAMLYQRVATRAPTSTTPRARGWSEQALGWRVRDSDHGEIFGHEGGKQGYRCSVVMDPAKRRGVIVLANARTDDAPGALALHLLLGEELEPPPPPMPPSNDFVVLEQDVLARYEGVYQLEPGNVFKIAAREDRLSASRNGGLLEYFALGPKDFGRRVSSDHLTFEVDSAGKVTGFIRYPEGQTKGERQKWVRIGDKF